MLQFGGKNAKRHFTVVMGGKEHGLYVSSTPSSAARKAVTKLCAANKSKKVEFSIREITQGSKKKTYGPYEGHIEKLKKPIELKGRVIKYKPVAKLGAKKGVQKGGEEFYHKAMVNDKIYNAIQKKLNDDQNFLTTEEKVNLGFNHTIQSSFFTKAKTYLWELYPVDLQNLLDIMPKNEESKYYFEDPKYYFGILKIKPKTFFSSQSIYIAFRVNISKEKLELIFLGKGLGIEEFLKKLVNGAPYSPFSQEYRNRSQNINELIRLIKQQNIESVVHRYDEFKRLKENINKSNLQSRTEVMNYQRFSVNAPLFNNKLFSASAPLFNNQRFSTSARPFNNKKNKKDIRIVFITTGVDLNIKIHNQIKEILDLIFHKYNTEEMSGNGIYMILFRGFTNLNLKKNKIEEYIEEISRILQPIRNEIENYNNKNFQQASLVYGGILKPQVTEFWKNESGIEERGDLRNDDE